MKLDAELVVLQACQSAKGKLRIGDGLLGMWRSLYISGVNSVAATLWNVDDAVSARMMEEFYDGIMNGKSKAEALRDAKRRMIASGDVAPAAWASLVLIGESGAFDPPLPKAFFGGNLKMIAAVLGVLMLVIWGFFWRRKRRAAIRSTLL